ncbi:hypothetical protein SDJN02_21768, partial [Cucurbita argyrosperma subsp. argyrosperma]
MFRLESALASGACRTGVAGRIDALIKIGGSLKEKKPKELVDLQLYFHKGNKKVTQPLELWLHVFIFMARNHSLLNSKSSYRAPIEARINDASLIGSFEPG